MVLQFPKDTLDAAFDIVEQSTDKESIHAFQALVRPSIPTHNTKALHTLSVQSVHMNVGTYVRTYVRM